MTKRNILFCLTGENVVDSQCSQIYIYIYTSFHVWTHHICSLRQSHWSETQWPTIHILNACKPLPSQVCLVEQLTMDTNINVWKYWYAATEPKPYLSVWYGNANKELEGMENIICDFLYLKVEANCTEWIIWKLFLLYLWINTSLINSSTALFCYCDEKEINSIKRHVLASSNECI